MAVGGLAGLKIPVKFWRPEGVENSLEIWQAGMSQNPHLFKNFLEGDEPLSLGREVIRFFLRQSKITFPALALSLIEKPNRLIKGRHQRFLNMIPELRDRIEQKLGENGVIICPVFPTPAPKHNRIWLNFLGIGYSGVFNILEFPATIIPIFHRQDGLPVSVQVVAGRWKDHLTMATAKLLEEIFGGWEPPERIGR